MIKSFSHNNEDITYGIESIIWKSLEKSFENDSIETFKVLNEFVINVLFLSIRNESAIHFSKYIIFPASYYHNTYLKSKDNLKFIKLHNYCTETGSMHLKEIISYSLRYDENNIKERNFAKLKLNNDFLYNAFNGFSRLLYSMISNGDISKFDYVINEYFSIDQLRYNNFNELKSEIRYNFSNESSEELKLKEELYEYVKYFEIYKRHVILGLRYWSIFLYDVKKNSLEVTKKFLDELRIYSDIQELLKDIINLRNNPIYEYFEWQSWDFKERPNGKVYSPPSVRNWLTFGLLIDLIKYNNVYLSSEYLTSKELEQINFFYDTIVDFSETISKNFDYWKPLLDVQNIEELEKRIENIRQSFRNLKRVSINAKDKEIADENLNDGRVQEFKSLIWDSWKNNSTLKNLFFEHQNIELVENEIKFIGQKTFFERAKRMFIDGDNYQKIYNVGEIGGQTSRWIDDEFLDLIISKNTHVIQGNKILDTIDKCLHTLKEKEVSASVILISSDYSYKDEFFLNDKNFIRKFNIEGKKDKKYFLGTYKNIDVVISNSDIINNQVIVSDFENSFLMKYKTNEDWFEHVLKIEVNSIDDNEAESIYNLNPNKWITRGNGIDLTKDEALILIKNAVNLQIGSYNEFEIINHDSYVVGLIQNKIE